MKYGLILALMVMASLFVSPVALAESPRDPHHMAKEDAHHAMEALMHLAKHPYAIKHLDAGKIMWLLKGVDHLSRLPYADHDKLFRMQVKLSLRLMDLQVKQLHHMSSYGPYYAGYKKDHYGYGYYGYGKDKGHHGMDRDKDRDHDKGDGHDEHGDNHGDMGHGDDMGDHGDDDMMGHGDGGDMHGDGHDKGHDGGMHDDDKDMMGHGDKGKMDHHGKQGHGYYDYRYDMYKYYHVYYDYYKYHYKEYGKYGYGKYAYYHDDYDYSYDYEYGKYHYFPKMWVHKGKPDYKPYSKYAYKGYKLDLDVHKMKYKSSYACHAAQRSATRHHAWDHDIFVGPCEQVGYHVWTFNVWAV